MNIPTIYQSLQEISLLQGMSLIGCLVGVAFALLWVERTRFVLPFWLVLNLLLSVLANQFLPAYIALAIVVTAIFSGMMIYVTARGRQESAPATAVNWPVFLFQFLLAIFFVLMVWGIVYQANVVLLADSADVTFTVLSLILLGVFRFGTTTRPLALGMGILIIITAVGVWQIASLQRPLAIGVWSVLVLLTTLVTSYLMQTEVQQPSPANSQNTQSIQSSM